MYICITGSDNNKDVYIKQSYRKTNGKTSSRIHRKLGKYNELLQQFSGDTDKLMAWAKKKPPKTLPNTTPKKKRSPSIFRKPTAFRSMKKDPFIPATFFCSSYATNYDWTTSAETSGITGRSPTIFTLFSRTLYTRESFLPPAN